MGSVIREIEANPLPQGCPWSFVSRLKRNNSTKATEEALLGGLRYKSCEMPDDPADQMSRDIKDWFAFTLDSPTCGLWGYFDEGKNNFKVTSGGITKTSGGGSSGKEQSLIELWNDTYFGQTLYVKDEGGEKVGTYMYSAGGVDSYATFVKGGEGSVWVFNSTDWQYKMEAKGAYVGLQMWNGGAGNPNAQGFARVYAYETDAGFSCSKSDDISSTLQPSTLYTIDKSSGSTKLGTYYAGGAWIEGGEGPYTYLEGWRITVADGKGSQTLSKMDTNSVTVQTSQSTYSRLDASALYTVDSSMEGNYYAGGAWIDDGNGKIDLTPPSNGKMAYFQSVELCVAGTKKTAYILMTDPV